MHSRKISKNVECFVVGATIPRVKQIDMEISKTRVQVIFMEMPNMYKCRVEEKCRLPLPFGHSLFSKRKPEHSNFTVLKQRTDFLRSRFVMLL